VRDADRDAAYVEYVTARQAHLRRIAYAICGDWHRAEDLLQTALTKLCVSWPTMASVGSGDAYVRSDAKDVLWSERADGRTLEDFLSEIKQRMDDGSLQG
jgi:DNA-directed RNA polymerase specialized sigma24 family protein